MHSVVPDSGIGFHYFRLLRCIRLARNMMTTEFGLCLSPISKPQILLVHSGEEGGLFEI